MTIAAVATFVQYLRNGTTTQWSYPNKIFAAADLVVTDLSASVPPVQTTLALGTDYTVSNVDVDTGALVTTTIAGVSGHTLDIRSSIARTQSTSIKNQGTFLPELHEEAFDRMTRLVQDLMRRAYYFGIHGPDIETTAWPALPIAATRAGSQLIFDSNGLPAIGTPTSQIISAANVGLVLNPITNAEIAAGITPTNYAYPALNPFRYGANGTGGAADKAAFVSVRSVLAQVVSTFGWSNGAEVAATPQTAAEAAANIIPASVIYLAGLAPRYGVDPTGVADSTSALQVFSNAQWAQFQYLDGQGLWNGGGGATPIATIPPGKYKVTGPTRFCSSMTLAGQAHPANTTSHTRIINNATGITPTRTWVANAIIPAGGSIQAVSGGNTYRYTSTAGGVSGGSVPAWPTAGTVTDGTVTWAFQSAVTAGDTRNNPILTFGRGTLPTGGTLQDQSLCMTIQNLEFWYNSLNGTFSNPLSGAGYAYGDYPLGGSLYFDCDCTDTRIVSCCFQNSPAGIRINNVKSGQVASDGFANIGTCNLWVEECEFDAGAAHVYATNSVLDLVFRNCAFFGGVHKYVGCTGRVVYENCRFYGGAYIDATDTGNSFTLFRVNGGAFDLATAHDSISIYGANILDIKGITMQSASGASAIVANFCSGGQISGNSINDAGFNASAGTSILNYVAAIKLIDCLNVLVAANNITTTDASTYGGFGIVTGVNVRNSVANFVTGNAVSGAYSGAVLNSQYRYINLANADYRGQNYEGRSSGAAVFSGPATVTKQTLAYSASMTPNFGLAGGATEFDITATNATAFTINAPVGSGVDSQEVLIIIRNTSGGALGAITWNAIYKMLTFTAPSNGGSCAIRFRFDGTNWVQTMPQTTNVPN
jgi:hypothetical protein